jgi:hypothetical protein
LAPLSSTTASTRRRPSTALRACGFKCGDTSILHHYFVS